MSFHAFTWHERLPTDQSAHGEGIGGVIRRHVVSYVFIAVLTMINKTWVAYLAIVHRYWHLVHACCFVDQLAWIAQHTVALSSTSSFLQRITSTTKGCCTFRLVREMAHGHWGFFLDAGLVTTATVVVW